MMKDLRRPMANGGHGSPPVRITINCEQCGEITLEKPADAISSDDGDGAAWVREPAADPAAERCRPLPARQGGPGYVHEQTVAKHQLAAPYTLQPPK